MNNFTFPDAEIVSVNGIDMEVLRNYDSRNKKKITEHKAEHGHPAAAIALAVFADLRVSHVTENDRQKAGCAAGQRSEKTKNKGSFRHTRCRRRGHVDAGRRPTARRSSFAGTRFLNSRVSAGSSGRAYTGTTANIRACPPTFGRPPLFLTLRLGRTCTCRSRRPGLRRLRLVEAPDEVAW